MVVNYKYNKDFIVMGHNRCDSFKYEYLRSSYAAHFMNVWDDFLQSQKVSTL